MLVLPPKNINQLMKRANALAGRSLGALAQKLNLEVPDSLLFHKGWVGELLELALGADSSSKPQPDFSQCQVELKTIPIDANGKPLESTYVCTAPQFLTSNLTWESSVVRAKLKTVLWIPVNSEKHIAIADRKIATPILWRLPITVEQALQQDYEELMEMLFTTPELLTAKHGEILQIRPKAMNSRARTMAVDGSGNLTLNLPRGFYLRSKFTYKILQENLILM